MIKYIVAGLILFSISIGSSENVTLAKYNKNKKLYSIVDKLSLRETPSLKGRKLGFLAEGEPVFSTGKTSKIKLKLKLRGKQYNEPWVYVEKNSRISGWVYGGGLSDKQNISKNILWRAVIIHDGTPNDTASEDWAWFANDIYLSTYSHGIISVWSNTGKKVKLKLGNIVIKEVDIAKVIPANKYKSRGYIFIQKNKKPLFKEHDLPKQVLKSASKYFGYKIRHVSQ